MSEHEHNTDSPNCWCRPTPKGNNVYLHKTWAEFLEYVEQLEDAYGELASLKAENEQLQEYADEGWAWVDEFCKLADTDVFGLRALLKERE
jgi:hypothetical protein